MYVIGGTYSEYLIDGQMLPNDELIYNYDMDASTWCHVQVKNTDYLPWNMVFHSVFKADALNIGILWYDYEGVAE